MQNDTNTYGYNQWFYFSIRYAKPHKKYTFRIVNFVTIYLCRKKIILFSRRECSRICFLLRKVESMVVDGIWVEQALNTIDPILLKNNQEIIILSLFKFNFGMKMISWWSHHLCLTVTLSSSNKLMPIKWWQCKSKLNLMWNQLPRH